MDQLEIKNLEASNDRTSKDEVSLMYKVTQFTFLPLWHHILHHEKNLTSHDGRINACLKLQI